MGNPSWVTTPYWSSWLLSTSFGKQFQNWISLIFIQLQLKGILAKESSPRTRDLNHILGRFNEICTSLSSVIHCYMSQFQTAGISSILIQMLRYFTDTQTDIQTVSTSIFRQINLLFPIFSWHWIWFQNTSALLEIKMSHPWPHGVHWTLKIASSEAWKINY